MLSNFQKKIARQLKKIDIFGQPVQLLINQEEGHKTLFGASLTLGLLVFFASFLASNIYTMSLRRNPNTIKTQIYHQDPDYYLYDSSNFTMAFAFTTRDFQTYIDESIYIVNASLVQNSKTMVDGQLIDNWITQDIPLTVCTQDLIRQQDLADYFDHLQLLTYYCIDWDQIDKLELYGQFTSIDYSQITIQFFMCSDATQKSKQCRSKQEIKNELERNYVSFQISSVVVDMKKSELPLAAVGIDIFTTISSMIQKEFSIIFEPFTLLTDFGLITENYEITKSLKYKDSTEIIDFNDGDLLLTVDIRLDPVEQQQDRSYKKIQSIFGELGGLWSVLFTIAFQISKPVKLLSYYLRILNSLFEFEQPSESDHHKITMIEDGQQEIFPGKLQESQLQETKAYKRLQSIKLKKEKLDVLQKQSDTTQKDLEAKHKLTKAISSSIRKYFQTISSKLKLEWSDYFYFFKFFQKKKDYKSMQISYSVKKAIKQMDILYIMKKLQEIDKLKMILLTEEQIKLFDYLQKPRIPQDPKSQVKQVQQYFSILKPLKSAYQRAVDAQVAFTELADNLHDPINIKLINSIDQHILGLLKLKKQQEIENIEECMSEKGEEKNTVLRIDVKQKRYTSYI